MITDRQIYQQAIKDMHKKIEESVAEIVLIHKKMDWFSEQIRIYEKKIKRMKRFN